MDENNECNSSLPASPPSSTDREEWASSSHPESPGGVRNASPSEVGESSCADTNARSFRVDDDPYSPSAMPQSSNEYDSREARAHHDESRLHSSDRDAYLIYDRDEDVTSELPSTTTADDLVRVGVSDRMSDLYDIQRPSSTSSIQYVGSYSPQQPASSSTTDYEVAIDNYARVSPADESYSVKGQHLGDERADHSSNDRGRNSEMSYPVSSTHVASSSPCDDNDPSPGHDDLYSPPGNVHRHFTPSPEDGHSLQELREQEERDRVVQSLRSPSPSHDDQQPSGSGIHSEASDAEVSRCISVGALDSSLVRLVGQRFSSFLPSGMLLMPQKEILVDSVMRTMIGTSSGRLLQSDALLGGVGANESLDDDPDTQIDVKDVVVSSVDDGDEAFVVDRSFSTMSDSMLDVRATTSAGGLGSLATISTDSLSSSLVTVFPSSSAVSVCHSLSTVSDVMASSSHLCSDSLVQVSHVGDGTAIHEYVSSSTGALDGDSLSLSGHTIILDATVDSTVGVASDCQIVGSSNGRYSSDVDPRVVTVSGLDYTSDEGPGVDHYSIVDGSDEVVEDSEVAAHSLHSNDRDVLHNGVNAATIRVDSPDVLPLDDAMQAGPSEPLLSTTSIPDAPQSIVMSRPRRAKQRMNSKNRDDFDTGLFCEECHQSYENGCLKHRVQTIYDKPVLTRAWASLPPTYLSIAKVSHGEGSGATLGVFAKRSIPKRTQFGPLEGLPIKVKKESSETATCLDRHPVLQIEMEGGEMINIDTSDESQSNWMRFVQVAESYQAQNLAVVQHGQSLYFTTTRNIPPRTELKVWYSAHYARRRGLPVLEPDEETKAEELANHWPCFECNKHFPTSDELQLHLDEHDVVENHNTDCDVVDEEADEDGNRRRPRHKGKAAKRKKNGGGPAKKSKVSSDPTSDVSDDPLSRRPRGRPPKKFRAGYEENNGDDNADLRGIQNHSGEVESESCLNSVSSPTSVSQKKSTKSLFKKKQANEWLCTHCELTFDNNSTLNLHILTHAAEDAAVDDVVYFATVPQILIDNEEQPKAENADSNERSQEVHGCPECTQVFQSKRELIEHAGSHGKIVARKSFRGIVNPAKPHKCELCYKSFATEDRLHKHMLVHGSEEAKPLLCSTCGKRFLNNSALACHIKVHSEEKKFYECPICREEFDQIVSLKDHIHVHCINGLYTCPSCQKAFDEYNQIRKHIRAFHSEKKFPCAHCEKIFPRPDKLKLHMLRHSNHREFLCANCGKQFKRKDKLKEHMKRMHSIEREHRIAMRHQRSTSSKKFIPKVLPTDYHRFIYKCHACLLGFKRRGMLVNHLAKRHPDIRPDSVPELNLPILKTTRDYYCQYCEKVYKSSSKRKAHILKQHPGAELPMSNRRKGGIPEIPGVPNPTFSQTVGSITTHPHNCEWCHKQYASKAKLLQHQRKKHCELLPQAQQVPRTQIRDYHPHQSQSQPRQPQTQHYAAVQNTIISLLQPPQLQQHQEEEEEEEQEIDHEQEGEPQEQQRQLHLLSATTQTSELEFEDSVLEDTKPIISRSRNVFVEHEDTRPQSVGVSDLCTSEAQVDQLPHADLLTQAMSELTQPLADYHTHDYQLSRISHSCPPSVVMPSPASTPGPPPHCSTPNPTHHSIEQTQLGRLLGHYDVGSSEVVVVPSTVGRVSPDSADPNLGDPSSLVATSTTFVPRTWASTYTDYSAR